jgi:hypothetical protein
MKKAIWKAETVITEDMTAGDTKHVAWNTEWNCTKNLNTRDTHPFSSNSSDTWP